MKKKHQDAICIAMQAVQMEISNNAAQSSPFAAGLAGEGYAGGYLRALNDVFGLLYADVMPSTRGYWEGAASKPKKVRP
jgi:hypothetical protein